jgi:hypothetical protein
VSNGHSADGDSGPLPILVQSDVDMTPLYDGTDASLMGRVCGAD